MIKPLLALVGPTASGKTEIAALLSKKIPLEVIYCDSMQVYRGMPILTQASATAHLASFLSLSQEYNAAKFRKDSLSWIEKILKRKKIPCLLGGTGLYLRALLDGLFETDAGSSFDGVFRKKMLELHEKHGAPFLHEKLKTVDPPSAAKIHPNDLRRIIRALEVHRLSGKPMSEQKPNRKGIRGEFDCKISFLDCDRAALYERINRRVDKMLKEGLVEEVRKIRKKKLSQTAGMALGIREIGAYLDKKIPLKEAAELLRKNTRNYAKRQIAWFRHEKGVTFVPVLPNDSAKHVTAVIADLISRGHVSFADVSPRP